MDMRYTAAVIFLCVTIPVVAGVLIWPAEEEEVSVWQPSMDVGVDITPTIDVSDAPNTHSYVGLNNNMFLFSAQPRSDPFVRDGTVTTTITAYEDYYQVRGNLGIPSGNSVETSASALWNLAITNYNASQPTVSSDDLAFITLNGHNTQSYFTKDNESYDFATLYANGTGLLFNLTSGDSANVSEGTFHYTGVSYSSILQDSSFWIGYYGQLTGYDADRQYGPLYLDMSKGLYVDRTVGSSPYVWTNGFINHEMYLLIKPYPQAASSTKISFGESSNVLEIDLLSGSIMVSYHDINDSSFTRYDLGSRNVYPYILIMVNTDSKNLTVYSLTDIGGFNKLYTDNLGMSASFTYSDGTFTSMKFRQGTFNYFVSRTSVEDGMITAIVDAEIKPADYVPGEEWTCTIKNPSVIGDTITIHTAAGLWV